MPVRGYAPTVASAFDRGCVKTLSHQNLLLKPCNLTRVRWMLWLLVHLKLKASNVRELCSEFLHSLDPKRTCTWTGIWHVRGSSPMLDVSSRWSWSLFTLQTAHSAICQPAALRNGWRCDRWWDEDQGNVRLSGTAVCLKPHSELSPIHLRLSSCGSWNWNLKVAYARPLQLVCDCWIASRIPLFSASLLVASVAVIDGS